MNISENEKPSSPTPKRRKGAGAAECVVSAFLCLLLAAFLLSSVVLTAVRATFSGDTLSDVIKSIISDIDAPELDLSDFLNSEQLASFGTSGNSYRLADLIYDNLDKSRLGYPVTRDEIAEIIGIAASSELVARAISRNVFSFGDDGEAVVIDADGIIDLLKENSESVSQVLGYELTDRDYDNIRKMLGTKFQKVLDALNGGTAVPEKLDRFVSGTVKLLFSDWLPAALWALTAMLALLVFLILKSFLRGLLWCGITVYSVGLVFALCGLLVFSGVFLGLLPSSVSGLLSGVFEAVGRNALVIGAIALLAGLASVIVSAVIGSRKKKKALS